MNIEATSLCKNICKEKKENYGSLQFPYQHDIKFGLMLQWKALIQCLLHQECHGCYEVKILSPAPECLHLWELLSKIICYFAIGCNDAEWLFTYCATKFYDTDIDLLCHQLDSLRHVQSTLVFHMWCVAQPDKENISVKNGTFPLLRNALNHIFW